MATPPILFDQPALDARRRRALAKRVEGADFLYRRAVTEAVERLAVVKRRFPLAAEVGSPFPVLADALVESGQVDRVVRLDRLPETHPDVVADPEMLPFAPGKLDLVVSLLALQWVNDLPGALAQVRAALKPDGLFLAAIVGGDTLAELRDAFASGEADVTGGAAPRVVPFADVRSLGALLQRAGFALPVADLDRQTVRYASALHLMRDLRAMGATNVLTDRHRRPVRRAVIARAAEIYAERFGTGQPVTTRERSAASRPPVNQAITATFDFVWLSGWSPHESQQKPLKPGSAKLRLADALNAMERSAGEKARPKPGPK